MACVSDMLRGAALAVVALSLVGSLTGCSESEQGFLSDKDKAEHTNQTDQTAERVAAFAENVTFPVYPKGASTADPDGDVDYSISRLAWETIERSSEWMVKFREHWPVQELDDFLAVIDKTPGLDTSSKLLNMSAVAINGSLQLLVPILKQIPYIEYVEEDAEVHLIPGVPDVLNSSTVRPLSVQQGAPWNLDRIDSRDWGLDRVYNPQASGDGSGVHVYVLDTGIRTTHSDFGGRAIPTLDVTRGTLEECRRTDTRCAADRNGHGTHCAGTVGGTQYGVAKQVTLHAVKVLGDGGSGRVERIVTAIDWVVSNGERPSVISMSLGVRGNSPMMARAIDAAVARNIPVVVAAGNENLDACSFSPAAVPSAITVGATGLRDTRADFSNYGRCLDIFAPGVSIKSAGSRSDNSARTLQGTSMACPHVAGAVATILGRDPSKTAAEVTEILTSTATKDVVLDVRGSPNLLLYVGATQQGTVPTTNPPTSLPPTPIVDACPWKTSTNTDNVMQCHDGTFCDATKHFLKWRCCQSHGGRARCPKDWPKMCNSKTCGGGDYCCSTNCVDNGGDRPCPNASPPKCPWLTSTTQANLFECQDGSTCIGSIGSVADSCCSTRGGRAKCPLNFPVMCNTKTCRGDFCCATALRHCIGGRRPCN